MLCPSICGFPWMDIVVTLFLWFSIRSGKNLINERLIDIGCDFNGAD